MYCTKPLSCCHSVIIILLGSHFAGAIWRFLDTRGYLEISYMFPPTKCTVYFIYQHSAEPPDMPYVVLCFVWVPYRNKSLGPPALVPRKVMQTSIRR